MFKVNVVKVFLVLLRSDLGHVFTAWIPQEEEEKITTTLSLTFVKASYFYGQRLLNTVIRNLASQGFGE